MPEAPAHPPVSLRVELAVVGADSVSVTVYELEEPATVGDVLRLAGLDPPVVGLFGQIAARQDLLADGDRIEVYRGPAVDAKAARRMRAARQRR